MLTFAAKYGKNIASQFGEDGIIEEICKRLDITVGTVCEFGAHNGIFCSNSRRLLALQDWKGVLIEGNLDLAKQCWELYATNRNVQVYCDMVTPENVSTMLWNDHEPFTLLSIDVDGIDAAIWKEYHDCPDIVIIEINSSLDPLSEVFADPERGSSFKSMYGLGWDKGYFLLCHTGNMIFVKMDYMDLFPEILTPAIVGTKTIKAKVASYIDPLENIDLYFNKSWR